MAALFALPLMIVSCGDDKKTESSIIPRKSLIEADAGSMFVSISAVGDWTIELEYPEATTEEWASIEPAEGRGNMGNVSLSYTKNTSEEARSLKLVLKPSKGYGSSATITQEGSNGAAGTGKYGDDTARYSWLELPATKENDGLEFFAHNMAGGRYVSEYQDGTRNYSFYWNYEEHLSLWVAYPLNKSLNSGSYYDVYPWGYDPLLPREIQPNITNSSYGGGWTRGHMLPRADRQGSYEKVASTCYPTNITPQEYDHNSGVWLRLENQVRVYASTADTLYVATGCILDGSTSYTGTSSGFRIKVPSAYFKALLYYGNNGSASATDKFMAAGYYVPHSRDVAENNHFDYIMTIKELENKTGIDFFVNLPAKVGKTKAERIESELIESFWK